MGRVIGTQDATPLEFWVLLDETEPVQQDEMIVVETNSPVGPLKLFGMVDIIRSRHQGSTFDSDVVEAERGLPVELSIAAHVRVTRLDPEVLLSAVAGRSGPRRQWRGVCQGAVHGQDGAEVSARARAFAQGSSVWQSRFPQRPQRRAHQH